MKQSLSQAIRNKLTRSKLDATQLAALQQRIAAQPAISNKSSTRLRLAGLLAAVLVTVLLTVLLLPRNEVVTKPSMPQLIANEVIKNHLNLKPLEVNTNNIDGLIHYFTRVDFLLRPSREVAGFTDNLIGGRYCSLQGITAAQLRLKSRDKHTLDTLYQTEYRTEVFGPLPDIDQQQTPLLVWARGIKVRIWVEKGILFAVTDVAATTP